jgi:tetratricopeptide (TPR) repeat protein
MWRLSSARRRHRSALRLWRAGHLDRAYRQIGRAITLYDGGPPAELAGALLTLGDFEFQTSRYTAAEATHHRAVAAAPPGSVRADALVRLGNIQRLRGRFDAAEATLRGAGASAAAHNALGAVYKDVGRYDDAAGQYRLALAIAPDGLRASIYHNLAGLAYARGRFAEAEVHARMALALRGEEAAPDRTAPDAAAPDRTAPDVALLGAVLLALGRYDEASSYLRRAYDIWCRRFGSNHHEAAVCMHALGVLHHRRGEHVAALYALREALAVKAGVLGFGHPDVAAVLNNLAVVHAHRGDVTRARRCYTAAIRILHRTLGPDHPHTVRCRVNFRHVRRAPTRVPRRGGRSAARRAS